MCPGRVATGREGASNSCAPKDPWILDLTPVSVASFLHDFLFIWVTVVTEWAKRAG